MVGSILLTAHIGTQDVVFDGAAGPYPVRVVVRPAGVVPGLAQISVRVLAGSPTSVLVQASPGRMSPSTAPKAEPMRPVTGEAGLYSGDLWLMTSGGYAVRIEIVGREGHGVLVLPVTSLATRRLGMSKPIGWALAVLGMLLVAGALTIIRGAVRDAVVAGGERPGDVERRRGGIAMATAALVLLAVLLGGWRWWRSEDAAYARTIDRPLKVTANVATIDGRATLSLTIVDSLAGVEDASPLIPDHGKIMHLFLVRAGTLDAFAHLHPTRAERTFTTAIPPLPAGRYRVYGDIVHESGLARTLVAEANLPNEVASPVLLDPDDSWHVGPALSSLPPSAGSLTSTLANGGKMIWERAGSLVAGPELAIRIAVKDANGRPAQLEPYMGMGGHAVVVRDDGAVFVHLHPAGTISLGAQQRLAQAARGVTDDSAMHDSAMHDSAMHDSGAGSEVGVVRFPFAFPRPGRYRIYVQVRIAGAVHTGAFETMVSGQ